MSRDSAREFVARVAADPAFAEELDAAGSPQARRELAAAAGYEFTPEELAAAETELPDHLLTGIVGAGLEDGCRPNRIEPQ